jgi:hypothetical protein
MRHELQQPPVQHRVSPLNPSTLTDPLQSDILQSAPGPRGIGCISVSGNAASSSRCSAARPSLGRSRRKLPTLSIYSWFLRAPFQFSKRAAGEATEFSRCRLELLSMIGAARLECGEPAAEASELIRRQLGNSFGDFFDFHVTQYSTGKVWLGDGMGLAPRRPCLLTQV